MPDSFVTVHHGKRHTDMLWRIATTAGGWVYMLPVVIYNGEPRWTVATDIADLLPPRQRRWKSWPARWMNGWRPSGSPVSTRPSGRGLNWF